MPEGEAIEHPGARAIENAQRRGSRNFDMRKQLLEYDDVANDQRKVIYEQRNELLESQDISETITAMRGDVLGGLIALYVPPQSVEEQWDIPGLEKALVAEYQLQLPLQEWLQKEPDLHEESLHPRIAGIAHEYYSGKVDQVGVNVCINTKGGDAANLDTTGGASGSARSSAPGYTFAGVCAEKIPSRNTTRSL